MNLVKLPLMKGDAFRVVVESPAGSPVKLKYDPETRVFELSRPLLKGLTYPFDWGFLPSTLAEDGDPLDAMVVHDAPTCPGLVVPCQLIGVLEVEQREDGERKRNDRVFFVPVGSHREDEINHVDDLPKRLRRELEKFFTASADIEGKKLDLLGWKGPKTAERLIEEGRRRFHGGGSGAR